MKCFYYIKLPNGGEIEISANYSLLTEDDDSLNNLVEYYYEVLNDTTDNSDTNIKEAKKKLINYLLNKKIGISEPIIKKVINKSNKENLISNLNSLISEGDIAELNSKLISKIWNGDTSFTYINTNKKRETISLEEFKKKISQDVKVDYLNDVNIIGMLGTTSINKILSNLSDNIAISTAYSSFNEIDKAAYYVINKTIKEKIPIYAIDFSGETNDSIVVYQKDSELPIFFCDPENIFSVFISTIRYIGNTVNFEDLSKVLENNKKITNLPKNEDDVKEFFTGKFDDKGKFSIGGFDKLLQTKEGLYFIKNTILPLIIESFAKEKNWDEKSKGLLLKRADIVISALNSSKYSKTALNELENIKRIYNMEQNKILENVSEFHRKNIEKYIEYEKQNYHYSSTNKASFEKDSQEDFILSANNFIKNNINIGRDLVKVKTRAGNNIFIVPEKLIINKGRILLQGFFKSEKKGIESIDGIIEPSTVKGKQVISIEYKKLENTSDVLKENEIPSAVKLGKTDSIIVYSDSKEDYLDPILVKQLATRGSEITTGTGSNFIVKAVYPAGMAVNGRSGIVLFNKVKSITTNKDAYKDLEFTDSDNKIGILKSMIETPGGKNAFIEIDDIIKYKFDNKNRYNKVVHLDKDNIYILYKNGENKYSVAAIKQERILNVYKKENEINLSESISVGAFMDKIDSGISLQDSNYSYFTNYELAKDGDFVIYNNEIYKILDKKRKVFSKILTVDTKFKLSKSYEIIEDTSQLTHFATERNISSNDAMYIAEMNNIVLSINKESEEYVPAVYIIPKNLSSFVGEPLDSGNLTIGRAGEYSYFYNENGTRKSTFPENSIDITEQLMIKLAHKKGIQEPEGLFIKKIQSQDASKRDFLVKNTWRYFKFDYQKIEEPERIKFLQRGAYIVLNNTDKANRIITENRIYRINNMTPDYLEIEYSKFSRDGKIISVIKSISIKDAINSIKYLYINNTNSKLQQLKEIANKELYKIKKEEESNIISSIANKFSNLFNIETEIILESPKDLEKKKAWIAAEKNPKIIINLGHKKANKEDFVHEYLHLFMFALKYKNTDSNIYEELLLDFKEKRGLAVNDLAKLEENFVEELTKFMEGLTGLENVSENIFVEAFKESLNKLELSEIEIPQDIFSILNSKMSDIFKNVPSKIADKGLIMFEANFRDWLSENLGKNIQMNCK